MAFGRTSLGSTATGGRSTGAGGQRPLSDINVTPLVDVMLVLLVIFIITAPLMASSIKLNLPRTDAGQSGDTPKFVSLVVDAAGKVYLNDKPVTPEELAAGLTKAAAESRDTEVQLRADQTVPYGKVVELMGIANKAGLSRIGFVTETPPQKP
ncbi:biopolymer transporter ExbD [Variovorax sp. J22P240]|uniref:ExbD/TolR family protein n=1 Tax=unclassified Variovorax TaxID=663243 RepID=UPI0025784ECE|nr:MULTISPECIES: biopolymer transporter ExbD [unclassified Variovorax]MDM0001530.1 biopolymer transporter ExbD [Variovorax sp. J22P240]MDM0051080.1 biopolymer transporter ExbD [Variovorax sp. J22R115]